MAADDIQQPVLAPPGVDHTNAGIAGEHQAPGDEPRKVAPATNGERNTLVVPLIPIACWRMDDLRFDFGLSFIRPEAQREIKLLASLVQAHPGAPLSVFGHADPTGADDLNKQLSGRRAVAVYAMLVRNTDLWEELYRLPFHEDKWGQTAVQSMLGALGCTTVREYQSGQGLTADGQAGPATRAKLFAAYMDFLCGAGFVLQPTDFLAKGAGTDGKGDYQGCGDFNPVLRASASQEADFRKPANKPDRDSYYAQDRRVTVFLFRPGSRVDPARWPCPSVSEGAAGCRKRFWSDHLMRRQASDGERKFEDSRDTFECRFYHRIAGDSPCEGHGGRRRFLRIFVRDEFGSLITGENYVLEVDGVTISLESDQTDGSGMVLKEIGWESTSAVLTVRNHVWQLQILQPPPYTQEDGARVRLANLGYFVDPDKPDAADLAYALWDFQHANDVERSAALDSPTISKFDEIHNIA